MTDKEMGDILKDMVIICDNREKKNKHILDYLKEKELPYIEEKMDTADYTFILPSYPELNLDRTILIERKNSLDEIAGNFTKDRERFVREFERVAPNEKVHILVEGATWKKLIHGSYRSKIHPRSLMASMITWNIRYNCPIWFATTDESPILIHNILHYELLEHLKTIRKNLLTT